MNIMQINASDSANGGASRVMLDLTRGLCEQGNEVSVFSGTHFMKDKNFHQIEKSRLAKIWSFISANDIDHFKTDYILQTKEFKNADVIHCHNLHGWYFNLDTLRKMSELKPVVWTLHDMWSVTPHCSHTFQEDEIIDGFFTCANKNIYPGILWHNERYLRNRKKDIYKKSKLNLVTPSQWLHSKIEKSILKDADCKVIYNGIDTEIFQRRSKKDARNNLQLPADKKILLFLSGSGNDGYIYKGGKELEEIANRLKGDDSVLFVCVGGAPRDVKRGANILYVNATMDKNTLSDYYSASDSLLFLSVAENFPLVILEAMSCGLPVVSFDVGGVPEAVTHKVNGYIGKSGSVDSIINGIQFVLSLSATQIQKISDQAIKTVSDSFSVNTMLHNYLALYKSLLH